MLLLAAAVLPVLFQKQISLSKKLREYNNFMFNVSRGFNVEEIASALPLHLQQEVFLHLHEHLVRQVRTMLA